MRKGLFLCLMPISNVEYDSLSRRIYNINEKDFEGVAIQVWKYQYTHNPIYNSYCNLLGIRTIETVRDIPYLPISLFKQHIIKTGTWVSETVFRSSGTTASVQSQHHIRSLEWYHSLAANCFTSYFQDPAQLIWLGLLPSYLDRPDSSLVDMVNSFMTLGRQKENGFFSTLDSDIVDRLIEVHKKDEAVILIGVTFALMDLFEQFDVPVWKNLLVLETGGMKGRGKELTREEVYQRMRKNHPNLKLASEYGMTELLSQSYKNGTHFMPGPQMKVFIRDISDPLTNLGYNQRGAINVIDLANVDTCAFIATDDIGIVYPDGGFEVLGRLDDSDLRGCNLLYA